MYLEESFVVNAPRERVWRLIRDPVAMLPCVPGCSAIEKVDEALYKAVIEAAVGPIKARFSIEVEITSQTAPEEVLSISRGEEGTRASIIQSQNTLRLSEQEPGVTQVYYASDVSITGRLGRFGLGMMKKIATRKAQAFEEAFRQRAEALETP
ncbi:MAG: SRPBCC domain-containing protein [Alphaproteobacteria bacterium]